MKILGQCEGTINKNMGSPYERRCERNGRYKDEGLVYCKTHDPSQIEARQNAREAAFMKKVTSKLNGWLTEARAVAKGNYIKSSEKFLVISKRKLPAHLSGLPLREISARELNLLLENGLVRLHTYTTDRGRGHSVTSRDYIWVDMSEKMMPRLSL